MIIGVRGEIEAGRGGEWKGRYLRWERQIVEWRDVNIYSLLLYGVTELTWNRRRKK